MISEREHQKQTKHSDGYVKEVSDSLQPVSARFSLENYDYSTSIIFFGTGDFSLTALKGLVNSGYNVVAVVTKPDSKSGRGHKLQTSSVKQFALDNDIEVLQPMKVADINDKIKSFGTDITGVLVSYGKIIPKSTIDLFKPGIINVHPSLLPKYRGPSPIESAIENGDEETGLSIMQLTPEMDAGPIYSQITHRLNGRENRFDLYETLAKIGTKSLIDILPSIIDGSLQPIPQNDSKATYCMLLNKEDAILNPEQVSSIYAERAVRAHQGFPKTKITISGHTIVITKAHVSDEYISALDVACSDGKYLSIDELIAPSGRIMTSQAFLNGYKLV